MPPGTRLGRGASGYLRRSARTSRPRLRAQPGHRGDLWTRQPDAAGYWASPTISGGTIYITGKDGKLLSFGLPAAKR